MKFHGKLRELGIESPMDNRVADSRELTASGMCMNLQPYSGSC